MAILVTGACGYIGSHAVHELLATGELVVALDDLSNGAVSVLPDDVPLIVGDVGDRELLHRGVESEQSNGMALPRPT